jgi:hypothetical protein
MPFTTEDQEQIKRVFKQRYFWLGERKSGLSFKSICKGNKGIGIYSHQNDSHFDDYFCRYKKMELY